MEEFKEGEVSESPLPKEEVKTMSFGGAIAEASLRKRIRRQAWPEEEYGFFEGDFLLIHKDGKDHVWQISLGDIIENDWISY